MPYACKANEGAPSGSSYVRSTSLVDDGIVLYPVAERVVSSGGANGVSRGDRSLCFKKLSNTMKFD
jgi:hypothetical protein